MNYSEQIRHPSGALDSPREAERSVLSVIPWWCRLVAAAIVALILVGKFRPAWLAKIGIQVPNGVFPLAPGNPFGWK